VNEAVVLSVSDRALLQLVYELMGQKGSWPTFTAVDLQADRELGIEDAQTALATIPASHIFRPWHSHGFSDNDEVRLRLRGVAACEGGAEDLALLEKLVAWVVDLERRDTGGPDDNLLATSSAFAEHLGLPLDAPAEANATAESAIAGSEADADPASAGALGNSAEEQPTSNVPAPVPLDVADARSMIVRLRVLADLLPTFWSGAGWQTDTPWLWQYHVDRQRLRPYRRVKSLDDLFAYVDSIERDRVAAAAAVTRSASLGVGTAFEGVPDGGAEGTDGPLVIAAPTDGAELDVLLTVLREEIADAAADLVRANQFDESIFAAMRRVEHELQQRATSALIGDALVKYAFQESSSPIRISERSHDNARMVQLFAGAIGLLKGDRSHKDRPALPCRSRRECLRVLAHASSLLDLLDRDIDTAPGVRGYEHHQGDSLTLWVERAGAQVDVWLDDATLLDKISFRVGTLVVDLAGVPAGEHRIHLVDGTRQGAAHTVWITREPGRSSWYRVVEVNVPLYADSAGQRQLDVAGLRLSVLEAGVASERIVPTRSSYQVGHYVDLHWSSASGTAGAAWARDRIAGPLRQVWDSSALFDGQPVAPAHDERLMKISFEPGHLRLRSGGKAPLRVLGHFTDGTATWTRPLDDPKVTTADEKVAFFKGGAVMANGPGSTSLRFEHEHCYAEAGVEVAAHARGTMTEFITGLSPVSGVAWTQKGLMVSARGRELWRVGTDGVYRLVASIPQSAAGSQGTDIIAAREDGELSVRVSGTRSVLVLHAADDYRSSHWVEPDVDGTPMALVWCGNDLVVAMDSGGVFRLGPDGTAELITTVAANPVDMASTSDALLVLCGAGSRPIQTLAQFTQLRPSGQIDLSASLWRVPSDDPAGACDLLAGQGLISLSGVLWTGSEVLLSEFHSGRVLILRNEKVSVVGSGLENPCQLAVSGSGEIFVAEFGAGAVRRIFA